MSLECSECERDRRGPHDPSCSRYRLSQACKAGDCEQCEESCDCSCHEDDEC